MTETGPTAPPPPYAPPPEKEKLPYGRLVAVLIVTLVVFAAAVLWSRSILVSEARQVVPVGEAPPPGEVGKAEIGIVDQRMFDLGARGEALRREQRQHLDSYGWVDRDAGVIHVPIQRAMDEVVADLARERGGGPP